MKHLAFILLLLVTEASFAQKHKLMVKIMDATSREWTGGAAGRYGTNYSIKLRVLTDKKIEFKNLWIGSEHVAFGQQFFSQEPNKKIEMGDSILLVHNKIAHDTTQTIDAKPAPIDYKGAALIEATVNGTIHYFIVKEFRKVKPLKGV